MKHLRWMQRLVVALVVVSALHVSSAAANGGIGGRPANPDPKNPRTQSIFLYTLESGASKDDQVLVSNNGTTKQTINLYAVDGQVTNTGAFTCKQKAESTNDLGGWISLAASEVTLEPGTNTKINFKVALPSGTDVGEHNGCIVFENKDDQGAVTGNVRLRTRQAIRVVATVPGDLHRQIDIKKFTTTSVGRSQHFELSLQNSGNVSADVDSRVTLTDVLGNKRYSNGGSYPVLRDQKLDLVFDTSDNQPLFGGWYYAQATIKYDKRAGTFGNADVSQLLTKSTEKTTIFIAPSPLGMLLLFIPLVAAIAWVALTLFRRRDVEQNWEAYVTKEGDTLTGIAKVYGTPWKKLARINHIKAPYQLQPQQEIKIPSRPTEKNSPTTIPR